MKVWFNFSICLLFLLSPFCLEGQNTPLFDQLVGGFEPLSDMEKSEKLEAYIQENGKLPLIENNTVIFLAKGSLKDAPKLATGFTGFLNPRYISDPAIGKMTPVDGSGWYYLKKDLEPDARIFYQIQLGADRFNDPLNPVLGLRFHIVNSMVRMPGFTVDPELVVDDFTPKGNLEQIEINSDPLGHIRYPKVYLPPGYSKSNERYPSLYFHDGSAYIEMAHVPLILDYLIANKHIEPVIAVFDDPKVRGKEYRGDEAYRDYVDQELTSYVDRNYRTRASSDNRLVIGGSRGGLSAIYLSHTTDKFKKCGVFSPAVHPERIQEFTGHLSEQQYRPDEVFILGAVYDRIWFDDAVQLEAYFRNSAARVRYIEISQGHFVQGWISELDQMLEFFFPFED